MSAHPRWNRVTRWSLAAVTLAVALAVAGCTVVVAADDGPVSWPGDQPVPSPSDPDVGAIEAPVVREEASLSTLLIRTPVQPEEPATPVLAQVATPPATGVSEGATELVTEPIESWKDGARLAIDDQILADAFDAAGYRLPAGSAVYVVEIIDGIDQPAYLLYEAGGGAFSTEFWPASTVKLLAAVAAVEYVGDLGFTGDAVVSMGTTADQTLSSIYEDAITVSSNDAYGQLLQIAGLDFVNREFLDTYDLDSMQYGSSFSDLDVTRSPQLTITGEQASAGDGESPVPEAPAVITTVIDAHSASEDYGSNDTDLFDLVEGLRRVMLADEIPEEDRFDLPTVDLDRIQQSLLDASPSYFEAAAKKVLGDDVIVANKAGWVPGRDCLDHAYIVDPDTGRHFLLAATQPHEDGCTALGEIAEIALETVLDTPGGIPLMADAGPEMDITVSLSGGLLHIDTAIEADQVLVFLDGGRLTVGPTGEDAYGVTLVPLQSGSHVLDITALIDGAPVSHRTLSFSIPAV